MVVLLYAHIAHSLTHSLTHNNGTYTDRLNLEGNRLTGGLPSELGLCESLVELNVADNILRGTLPSELGNLRALRTIQLQQNNFQGTVPPELCTWTGVTLNADFCPQNGPNCIEAGCLA